MIVDALIQRVNADVVARADTVQPADRGCDEAFTTNRRMQYSASGLRKKAHLPASHNEGKTAITEQLSRRMRVRQNDHRSTRDDRTAPIECFPLVIASTSQLCGVTPEQDAHAGEIVVAD